MRFAAEFAKKSCTNIYYDPPGISTTGVFFSLDGARGGQRSRNGAGRRGAPIGGWGVNPPSERRERGRGEGSGHALRGLKRQAAPREREASRSFSKEAPDGGCFGPVRERGGRGFHVNVRTAHHQSSREKQHGRRVSQFRFCKNHICSLIPAFHTLGWCSPVRQELGAPWEGTGRRSWPRGSRPGEPWVCTSGPRWPSLSLFVLRGSSEASEALPRAERRRAHM